MSKYTPAEEAIRAFDFGDYSMDEVDPKSEYAEWVPDPAKAVEAAVRAQIAADIEAHQPTAHPVVCPPSVAWEAGRDIAAAIARHGRQQPL